MTTVQDYREHLNNAFKTYITALNTICPGYIVDDNNKKALMQIVVWACRVKTDLFPDIDPNKGLYLVGAKGTGKSIALRALSYSLKKTNVAFKIVNANDIAEDMATGNNGEYYHSNFDNGSNRPFNLGIDDLGFERKKIMYFGNEVCPLAYILSKRYMLLPKGIMTHITSNLTGSDIEENGYGDRIRDRLREMCNEIVFKGESRRK